MEVRWPAADGRPFEMWAVYRLSGTATLDLETGVRAVADIAKFESFLASYFEKRFTSCRVHVKGHEKTKGRPGFLAADPTFGTWLMAPRDADAVRIIQDGRWKIEPSPVDWAILPEMDRPLSLRRDAASGVTVVVMARPEDCFAVATPHETEPHYSLYLSLFGRDLKAGEEARAHARLLVLVSPGDEQILEAYEAFLKDVRRS